MTKRLLLAFSFALLALPLLAAAQENQPQPGTYCPHLTRDLKRGDRDATTGGQVTELQKFLVDYYELNPDDYLTGYFGRATQNNVIRFQSEQGLPAFGYVGPLTRAAIARVCGQTTIPAPISFSASLTYGTVPLLVSFSARNVIPTASYVIDFGDNSDSGGIQAPPCASASGCTITANHTYASAGTYTATLSSYNPLGQCPETYCTKIAVGTATITVAMPQPSAAGFTGSPTNGTAPLAVTFSATNLTKDRYSVAFGDGVETDMPTIFCNACNNGAGSYSGTLSHTFATAGTFTAILHRIYHVGGPSGPEARESVGTVSITANAPTSVQPPTVSLLINGQSAVTLTPGSIFTVAWSSSNATSCSLTNAQGQTGTTPPNTSTSNQGAAPSAGQTFTYTLACTNSGGTTTKTASVTGSGGSTSNSATLTASPSSGAAPLTVTFSAVTFGALPGGTSIVTVDYGDGSAPSQPLNGGCVAPQCNWNGAHHTYASTGTYTAKLVESGATLATATVTVTGGTTASNVGSCTYKGQSYAEGQSITLVASPVPGGNDGHIIACDNGSWIVVELYAYYVIPGEDKCGFPNSPSAFDDFGCGSNHVDSLHKAYMGITPRHGRSALTVTAYTYPISGCGSLQCAAYSFSWGDGTTENIPARTYQSSADYNMSTHIYTMPGSYAIRRPEWTNYFVNIRVDAAGTASIQNQSQLASALTALQSALQAILALLH